MQMTEENPWWVRYRSQEQVCSCILHTEHSWDTADEVNSAFEGVFSYLSTLLEVLGTQDNFSLLGWECILQRKTEIQELCYSNFWGKPNLPISDHMTEKGGGIQRQDFNQK